VPRQAIALPTDTLYGLAAAATSAAGVRVRLALHSCVPALTPCAAPVRGEGQECECAARHLRGGPPGARSRHALGTPATLSRVQDVCRFARTEHLPAGLLESLLPGPVTLLLERLPGFLCDELNPGLLRIGVRVPDSAFVRAVAREFGEPLALTSANRSGGQSSVSVAEFSELWHAVRPETATRCEPALTPCCSAQPYLTVGRSRPIGAVRQLSTCPLAAPLASCARAARERELLPPPRSSGWRKDLCHRLSPSSGSY